MSDSETRPGSTGNVLAAALSFFIPGLGQLTQGRVIAALFWFVAGLVIWVVTLGVFGWIANVLACLHAAVWKGPR